MEFRTRREIILATVKDAALDLMVYDRQEDDYLLLGDIERAVKAGEITWDEIVEMFRKEITT